MTIKRIVGKSETLSFDVKSPMVRLTSSEVLPLLPPAPQLISPESPLSKLYNPRAYKRQFRVSSHLEQNSLVNKEFFIWDRGHHFLAGHNRSQGQHRVAGGFSPTSTEIAVKCLKSTASFSYRAKQRQHFGHHETKSHKTCLFLVL